MLARMRAAVTVCLVAAAFAGCGGDDGDDESAGGLAQEAAAVVEQFERSLEAGDFERICSEVLSADLRRQVGGGDCPAQLERTAAGVRRPRIEVREIRIEGAEAAVDVVTTAQGQERAADTIRLVREAGGYRISSLSG
jgi:hypothetical protein